MHIINLAGYKFISLNQLPVLRELLLNHCTALALRGTILLSCEGININLSGLPDSIAAIKDFLAADERFADLTYRESFSRQQPFNFMKVKIKKEIITLGVDTVKPTEQRAPSITPAELKSWLDNGHDFTLLDTRNGYEVRFGTFNNALHCDLSDFGEFPESVEKVPKDKPVVMFCTGGIRCEKAALHLLNAGFSEVMQLEGGILNYFAEVGGAHYDGECFVFDQRIAVNANLAETGTAQCLLCQGPVTSAEQQLPVYEATVSCPGCATTTVN
jgi:UPF0176 protein